MRTLKELAAPLWAMMPGEKPAAEIQTWRPEKAAGHWVLELAFLGFLTVRSFPARSSRLPLRSLIQKMSNTIITTNKLAGPSHGMDTANTIIASTTLGLAGTESTQALPGCETLEDETRALHAEIDGLARKTLSVAYRLGSKLKQLKAALKQSSVKRNWEAYVRDHLGIHPRSASNYMRIHREASTYGNISELLKSETVSEIGIRDVLEKLAQRKARDEEAGTGQAITEPTKAKSAGGAMNAAVQLPLKLADGSRIDFKRIQWREGLIRRNVIESWISKTVPNPDDPGWPKAEARRQRIVVELAAGINRSCGNAKPDAASKLVESSLDALRALLRESIG